MDYSLYSSPYFFLFFLSRLPQKTNTESCNWSDTTLNIYNIYKYIVYIFDYLI